jgi:hypothetical protein
MEDSYPRKGVHIGNQLCRHTPDPDECHCHFTGLNIILLDEADVIVANQTLSDTCEDDK